jgi:hypothetical protein
MSYEICSDPLELDLAQERIRRLYSTALDVCLGRTEGRYTARELELHQGYLSKIFNPSLAGYIMLRAYEDARDLQDTTLC